MEEILHKLAHYFCINKAIETTEVIGGVKYPAFRCIKCGKVD